ncbi:MAG: hypothetical protein JW861_07625 [Bacteroidales bacterium]|nr:hypothetical protein [Bacteroidales bacterium]
MTNEKYSDVCKESILGVEENLYDLYIQMGKISNRILHVAEDISWVNCRPTAWPNFIFNPLIPESSARERVGWICDQIRKKIAPPFWLTSPKTKPDGLAILMEEQGMRVIAEWPGIVMDSNNIHDYDRPLDYITIPVTHHSELEPWLKIASRVLFNNGLLETEIFEKLIPDPRFDLFLGLLDDKPVASEMNYYAAGVNGMYMGATLPEYRKMGIGKAIVYDAAISGREKGFPIAIAQSSVMGLPSWKKLGFNLHYNMYLWWMVGKEFKQ